MVPFWHLPRGSSKMVKNSFKIAYQKTGLELGTSLFERTSTLANHMDIPNQLRSLMSQRLLHLIDIHEISTGFRLRL